MTNYKTFDVWKLSMEIVKEIYILTKIYPADEKYSLVDQTKKQFFPFPCNVAEGIGEKS